MVFSISCHELVWAPLKETAPYSSQESKVKTSTVDHFKDELVPENALLLEFQDHEEMVITSLLDRIDLSGLKVRV